MIRSTASLLSSVLITRHDKIGDFVLALPLCKAIKTARPELRLGVLVAPVNADFAREIPFIDTVICYRREDPQAALQAIRAFAPEASISCFIDPGLGWLLWRAGIRRRIAPATKIAQVLFNQRIKQRRSRVEQAEFEYNLALGRALIPELPLACHPPLLAFATAGAARRPDVRRVAFHPGSGGSTDGNLRLADYLSLGRRLARLPNLELVFTFGPDDRDLLEQVRAQADFPVRLIDGFASLRAFCEFLQGCALFVSTSTGPMHLAGAVNTPTLSFFGESRFASSARWRPLNAPERQHAFMLSQDYGADTYARIEQCLLSLLEGLPVTIARNASRV